MLTAIARGLLLVRHIALVIAAMGAATATVAGAVDMSQSTSVRTVTPVATVSPRATEQPNTKELEVAHVTTSEKPQRTVPAHEPAKPAADPLKTDAQNTANTRELYGLISTCVATHERSSEPCARALELSGLSADEFWAKVTALFNTSAKPSETPKTAKTTPTQTARPTTKPTEKPRTSPAKPQTVTDTELIAMVRDCFTKYMAATASKGNEDLGRAAYEACTKAIGASGLSNDAFWAKFGTPREPKI